MSKLIVVAQCKDPVKWEQGFRTHAELFKSQTVNKSVSYGMEGNQVAVCLEPDDFANFMRFMDSPATAEAMDSDGVLRDTVKMFVLDHELRI